MIFYRPLNVLRRIGHGDFNSVQLIIPLARHVKKRGEIFCRAFLRVDFVCAQRCHNDNDVVSLSVINIVIDIVSPPMMLVGDMC